MIHVGIDVRRIVAQQVTVFFHSCAAASGIDDDRVNVCVEKDIDVAPGHSLGGDAFAVMGVQGATADLITWQNNVTAVALEHSYGRFVHISE